MLQCLEQFRPTHYRDRLEQVSNSPGSIPPETPIIRVWLSMYGTILMQFRNILHKKDQGSAAMGKDRDSFSTALRTTRWGGILSVVPEFPDLSTLPFSRQARKN